MSTGSDLKGCGKCILCKDQLNTSTIFTSSVTNERFLFNGGTAEFACKTKGVVYLITCELCKIQYVGETKVPLASRFYGHRGAIKRGQVNTVLYQHFLDKRHSYHHCKVQIIYVYNKDDDGAKQTLLNVEEFYMRKLGTLYPFGLNDKITSLNITLTSYDFMEFHSGNTPFFTFPSARRGRSHGHRKSTKTHKSPDDVFSTIDLVFDYYKSYQLHHLYTLLRSLSHPHINDCLENIYDYTRMHPHKGSTVRLILQAFRSKHIEPPDKDKEVDFVYFSVPFVHSAIEKVGVEELLKYQDVTSLLPLGMKECRIRTTYSYGPTIGRKLFNYNKILNTLSKKDLKSLKCDCKENFRDFIYEPHGHVHTGNLDVIQCEPLRDVMAKGAKFRLKPSISKSKLLNILLDSISKLKKSLARKCSIPVRSLDLWHDSLVERVKHRVKTLTSQQLESNDIFQREDVSLYIKKLQSRFVIVPVDKASNNFAIICKKFYLEVLMKELGITSTKILGNNVYKHVKISQDKFFLQQEKANKEHDSTLSDSNRRIPLLYWTSKQHKNPYKFRFIAGASHCYNKDISVEVSLALKCIKTHFKNYCAVIKKNSGLNYFWSIDNSMEFICKLCHVEIASSIKTYDFSTLYTNLPLDYIYECLEKLIIKMFQNSNSVGLMVNSESKRAFWSRGCDYSGYKLFTVDKLLEALRYILYNTYVQFAGCIFKQTQGIPMGGNASPFIADLCLAWAEFSFMQELVKSKDPADLALAKTLSDNSRYIDDISVINYLRFGEDAKKIYHSSLILEESASGYHYDTFLDLNVRIFNNNFTIGIYHKVDDFSFEVINFPFPESNIHSKIGYNAFYSQLVRFYRLCNNIQDFAVRTKMLYSKLASRGYTSKILIRFFLKFCSRYPVDLKYGLPDGDALWSFVQSYRHSVSCCIYNHEVIQKITKPCEISLVDIDPDQKLKGQYIADSIEEDETAPSQITPIEPEEICIVPQPLANPLNHCYVNSILQILYRVFISFTEGTHINNNKEGCLVDSLLKTVYTDISDGLTHFKIMLAKYNTFFDGLHQRDAYECLDKIIQILHLGTRQCLIDDDVDLCDEQLVVSLPKRLFTFVSKTSLQCSKCRFISTSYSDSQTLFLYPDSDKSIPDLISDCSLSSLSKLCRCCNSNTLHEQTTIMEHPPEILILVISRFGRTQDTTKNTSKIEITASLNIAAQSYGLIGSVHHHGSTIASGHYTSNIYFPKTAFTCNDSSIEFMRPSSFSESSYLVFYARGGCHYGTQRMGARSHDAGTSDDATSRVEEQASKPAQLVLPPDDLTT